jgi:hypothetical protein
MINFSGSYTYRLKVAFVYEEGQEEEIIARFPLMFKQDADGRLMRQSAGWMRCAYGEVIDDNGQFIASNVSDFSARYIEVPEPEGS